MERLRIDQDIFFAVNGVSCKMSLDLTGEGSKGDLWIIQPSDSKYFNGRLLLELEKALERLAGWDENRVPVREPRQRYSWKIDDEKKYVWLEVGLVDLEDALLVCIMMACPEWNGESLNFTGSQRMARLLADWKDAFPEIQFTRANGTPIEYEQYVGQGGRTPVSA